MLDPPDDLFPGSGLTRREREVLMVLATGASNRQIGATLYLSEKSVKQHMSNAMRKLGARNRTQLALMFLAATRDSSSVLVDPMTGE
jgi:DNA-binding NarL/FixJ family response regulator